MGEPELGPLTNAISDTTGGKPPAIIREWSAHVNKPGDIVLFWAAATKSESASLSWYDLTVRSSNQNGSTTDPVTETPAANIERLLSPMAHEARIRIMQSLYDGPLSSSALSKATSLQGGGFYHHLRELRHAAYIHDEKGQYCLTRLGHQLLATVATITSRVIVDRGEKGLGTIETPATSRKA